MIVRHTTWLPFELTVRIATDAGHEVIVAERCAAAYYTTIVCRPASGLGPEARKATRDQEAPSDVVKTTKNTASPPLDFGVAVRKRVVLID